MRAVLLLACSLLLGAGCTVKRPAAPVSVRIATALATTGTPSAQPETPSRLAVATSMATATSMAPLDTRAATLIAIGAGGRKDTHDVALTFDAGADAGYTALILDTLARNQIVATFGMTGQWAEQNPDLLRRIAAAGHQFMNHTWDHRSWTGLSDQPAVTSRLARWDEIDRTETIVHQLTGGTTLPYFRAPFGDQDASVQADIGLRGYRYDVLWTIDTRGWAGATPGQITAACSRATPGAIIVMHVGAQSQDGPALQSCIDAIRDNGLGFATVAQLIGGV